MNVFRYTVIAGLLIVALTGCGSSQSSAVNFVESGKVLLAEGKVQKARLEFKNAIQIDPRMAEPFYQLALIDEKDQKWKGMFANLSTVEQLAPTHYDAIVKLGQIHLLAGNFDIAMEKANKVLAADSKNIMALVLRASINMKQTNFSAATSDIEQALSLDSSNIEALSVKTLVLHQQGKPDQALAVLAGALKANPDELPLTMIKLSILEGQKDYSTMEQVYRALLVKHLDAAWVTVSLAKLLNIQDRYEDAKLALKQFIDANPDDAKTKLILVSLTRTKEPEKAIALLDNYISQDKDNFELRFSKVQLQFQAGQVEPAVSYLKEIVSLDPEGNDGRKAKTILASIDFQNGNIESAAATVQEILASSPEDESSLLLKARIEILNKNIDTAVTNLRVVLRNNPESEQALVLLAQAYMNSGSDELADDNFRQALVVNPGNTIAALSVANSLMKNNDLNRTEDVLIKALKKTSNKESLLRALAQVRLLKKDWLGTESIIDSLRTENKESSLAYYFTGRISQGQGDFAAAVEEYKAALALRPDISRALQGLGYSYLQLEQKQELLDYLVAFIDKNPSQLAGYSVLSNVYSQDKLWDEAIAVIEKGLAVEAKWQGGYSVLAAVYFAQKKPELAIRTYQRGLENNSNSPFLSLQLASAFEQNGEFEKAKNLYQAVLAKDESIEPAINNLASLYTDQLNSEDNLQKALQLSGRFKSSTEPYYLDTYAWVHVQLGQLDKAQSILERVVSLSPDVAVFNYHLGALLVKQGNKNDAKVYLIRAKDLADKQGDVVTAAAVQELLVSL